MKSLEKQERSEIVKQMSLCFVSKDTVIFKQGLIGRYFYIIKKGRVRLLINKKVIKSIKEGENFGELDLLYCAPRSGTIIAETDCHLWVMERKIFQKKLIILLILTMKRIRSLFKQHIYFPFLNLRKRLCYVLLL